MRQRNKRDIALIFVLLLFIPCCLQAVIIGANSAVSRQALVSFPGVDSDNEMRGFAAFENGFTLENSSTTCVFNSYFPVSGAITLNAGTLLLNRSMVCKDGIDIVTGGTFKGNGHAITLCSNQVINLPSILSNQPTQLQSVTSFYLGAQIYTVDWSYDNAYVAVGLVQGTVNELHVFSFNGTSLTYLTSIDRPTSVASLRWHPSDYYIAFGVYDEGYDFYVYYFNTSTNTLSQTGQAYLTGSGGATAWHPTGNYVASTSTDNAEEVEIFSFSSGSISSLTVYNLSPNRDANHNAMDWHRSGNYLAVGFADYAGEPELIVFYFNGSTLVQEVTADPGAAVTALEYSPTDDYIAIGLSGTSERLRIYEHNVAGQILTEKTSARVGETLSVLSVDWSPNGDYLIVGRATGAGTEFRLYSFNRATITLTEVSAFDFAHTINAARWSPNGSYIVVGDAVDSIYVYQMIAGSVASSLIFNNAHLILDADINLKKVATFQGECSINGNGHVFDLQSTASILIDTGARLLCRDVTIRGIADDKILCLDSASTLSLSNVIWQQDGNFTFTQGHIDIVGDVTITGTQIFTYQSNQVSTIFSKSTLYFDAGMTFSYDPQIANNNLFAMEDSLSTLHLYETSLHATSTGLHFTKGTLVIEGTCPVLSEAGVKAEGVMLGDGVWVNNNINVKILPESGFDLRSGFLVYNNV